MPTRRRGKLLLAQRANVDCYPPVLHQIRLLGPSYESTVVDSIAVSERDDLHTDPEVRRLRIRERRLDGPASLLHRTARAFAFAHEYKRELAASPDVAIAYDADTAALLLRSRTSSTKRVVHLHETLDESSIGRSTRIATRRLKKSLDRADLVTIPDAHRANMVSSACELAFEPLVVMNCPLLVSQLPTSRLIPALRERGIVTSNIAHYQGAIGPDHYLDTIISSMKQWPDDAVFVMVGGADEDYLQRLREQASALGLAERVIWLGRVPYRELFSYSVGAAVGLSFFQSTNDNFRYAAGASNKRFEYAALGIAQITGAGIGVEEIFGRTGHAVMLDRLDPRSMGEAIGALLSDPNRRTEMGERARRAHLSVNNYERQFAPVISRFDSWRGAGR